MDTTINVHIHEKELEKFLRKLNQDPDPRDLVVDTRYTLERTNENGQKIKVKPQYLPISFVQTKLDELFYGLWETEITYVQVIANEIIVNGVLTVTHPVTGQKIRRAGAAAAMIQQKAGADITDISAKYKNTLTKDFPHAKEEVTKNAAKSLGKIFGRDINREYADTYQPQSIETESAEELRIELKTLVEADVLPPTLHTFIEANYQTSDFRQLLMMKSKVEKDMPHLLKQPEA